MTFIRIAVDSLPFPLDLCVRECHLASVLSSLRSQQTKISDSRSSFIRVIQALRFAPTTWFRLHWLIFKLRNSIHFHQEFPMVEVAQYNRSLVDDLNKVIVTICETLREIERQIEDIGIDRRGLYRGAYLKLVGCRESLEDIVEARYIALNSDFTRILRDRIAEAKVYNMGHS